LTYKLAASSESEETHGSFNAESDANLARRGDASAVIGAIATGAAA